MSVQNQRWIYSYLVDQGFSPNAAAGIVGNIIQESGGDPNSNQVGGPGMGICQWSQGERWQNLLAFAQQQGKDPHDLKLQVDFMLHEMKAYGIYARLQNMNGLERSTRLFMNVFERPDPAYANLGGRIEFARTLRERNPDVTDKNGNGGGNGGGGNGGGNNNGAGPQDLTKAEYGFAKQFLDAHPDIAALVDKADKQNWTAERFQAELKTTRWYRQLSTAQQQWSVTVAEHPGEAQTQVDNAAKDVQRIADSLGVELSHAEIEKIATQAARNQLDSTDLTSIVAHQYQIAAPGTSEDGAASTTIDQLRELAYQYGQNLSADQLQHMTRQVIGGTATSQDFVDKFREQAKVMYPGISKQLDTMTLKDLMDPYTSMASDELGIPPDQMRLYDPKWTRALTRGQGGAPMTADEWQSELHTNRKYGYDTTNKASGEAAQLATSLSQMFGAM